MWPAADGGREQSVRGPDRKYCSQEVGIAQQKLTAQRRGVEGGDVRVAATEAKGPREMLLASPGPFASVRLCLDYR